MNDARRHREKRQEARLKEWNASDYLPFFPKPVREREDFERWLLNVKINEETGCWEWYGLRSMRGGYGQFSSGANPTVVHRWTYERFVGLVPEGLVLDHLCRNPRCCNPAHLEPVTNEENARRGAASMALLRTPATHCKRGHEYTDDNKLRHYGARRGFTCRTCAYEANRRYRARKRAEDKAA